MSDIQNFLRDVPMPESMQNVIAELMQSGNLAGAGNLLGQAAMRQALFDTIGTYPSENVMPYWYGYRNTTAGGNAIAASSTGSNSIKITAEAAFLATDLRVVSTGAFRIFARIDSSDRQLMNEQQHINNVAGTAQRPGFLAKPLLLPANTTISFDMTDLTGSTNEVELTMNGYKIYNFG